MPTTPCRIRLLGGVQIELEDRPITGFRTRQTAALLGYLAFYPARPHARELLIEVIWPEDDLDSARHKLRDALSSLQEKRLAGPAGGADSRVTKYEHRLQEVFNFDRREIALICVLLLRGPQTPGELRGRAERMYRFEALEDVQSGLQKLMDRQPPLVRVLARQPGTKESRYTHLFSGDYIPDITTSNVSTSSDSAGNGYEGRLANLETTVSALKSEVEELRRQLTEFTGQFK